MVSYTIIRGQTHPQVQTHYFVDWKKLIEDFEKDVGKANANL